MKDELKLTRCLNYCDVCAWEHVFNVTRLPLHASSKNCNAKLHKINLYIKPCSNKHSLDFASTGAFGLGNPDG